MNTLATNARLSAIVGFLCVLPFLVLNFMVGQSEFNPAFSWIRE